jgi:hypothetical protein
MTMRTRNLRPRHPSGRAPLPFAALVTAASTQVQAQDRPIDLAAATIEDAVSRVGVGAYTRADVRLEVPLTRRFTASVAGQNLFDPVHAEFAGAGAVVTPTLVPRSVRVQLAWRY